MRPGVQLPAVGRTVTQGRVVGHVGEREVITVIADYGPSVLGNALGRTMHCTSLDNTIRYGTLVDTDWVLCDNRMEYVGDGFGYTTIHLWSQDRTLLATASQSMVVRIPAD
ncbi:MAG: hypothetical protein AAGC67_07410 [Myxococcota bacterium]